MDAYWLGASYYPEQWPKEAWRDDFRKMADLGINVVRMAEFAWSSLQPAQGHFELHWLDDAIALAAERNIAVLLGVPTAAVPAWLYRLHPEVLGGNERGPYSYGGRKGFSVHSPAMKVAAQAVIHAMGQRYARNPAVVGWQLSNEPGFPFTAYDTFGLRAYRAWLRKRYVTLDALNQAWGGNFWSNRYDQWDEIQFPVNVAESGFFPAWRLDYRRFFSESYLSWLRSEATTLRDSGVDTTIFVNWPDTQWSVDIYASQSFLNATAWDNYGPIADDRDYHTQYYSAMNHDLCRCSRADQRFFVAEQRSQAPATSSPAAVRLQTLADLAHGSFGTVYFEWRPPVSGGERGYVSILERDGSLGASAGQIQRVGSEIRQLWSNLRTAKTHAMAAMLFSYENQWDLGFAETDTERKLVSYDASFARFYAGAKVLGQNIDIIPPEARLDGYRIVIAPGLQILSESVAARLSAFVAGGGCLVLDQRAGTRNSLGHDRSATGPGVFSDIAGIHIEGASRVDGELPSYHLYFPGQKATYAPLGNMEKIDVSTATVLASIARPDETPLAALTANSSGKGLVVYFGASSADIAFYEESFRRIQEMVGFTPILEVPSGIEVVSRMADRKEYVFVQNFLPVAQSIVLPRPYRDAVTNALCHGSVTLEPFDVKVLFTEP
jgi:beta-galactosidase